MPPRFLTDSERLKRFESRYMPEPNSGCWIWLGCSSKKRKWSYGQMRIDGTTVQAHRYSWLTFYGEIPKHLLVCHKCDNTLCVNPYHLFLGTQKDNMIDAKRKQRTVNPPKFLGSQHWNAKLTESQVARIRELLRGKVKQENIAMRFGVSRSTISMINIGDIWRHVN